jgi:hypothetical protein
MANRRFIDFPIATTVGDSDIILIWQSGVNKQTTKATFLSGLPENLDELNDVAISGLTNGQILRYDSVTGKWENTDQGNLDLNDLNDVSIVSPSNGQVLVYNSSTSKWENSSGGFVPYTGAVTTVNLGAQTIQAGQFVKAGGTSSQFLKADGSVDSSTYGTGTVTSVALTMPTAFSVANSPVTTAGTLAVTATGTTAQYIRGDGSLATFPGLTGFVPYTGATADVNLGTHDLTAERGTFENNGSSNTLTVNHTSGSGYGIIVTKGGNNEALYVSKTSGSGNAMTVVGGRTSLVDLALSSVTNTAGDFLTLSGGVVHKRTAAEVRTDIGAGTVTSVGLSSATSGVTIGSTPITTSGTITLAIATASGSQNGLLSSTDWTTFNSKQNALTLTTTGTSGAATLVGSTLNIPQYQAAGTYVTAVTASSPLASSGGTTPNITIQQASGSQNGFLSSTDWTTFNNKQNALTNPVTGTGTTNYLAKFTGSTTVGNSQVFDNGTNVGINRNNPTRTLDILGASGVGTVLKLEGASGTTTYLQLAYNGATNAQSGYIGYNSSSQLQFFTNDTLRATIDASGNVGIGTASPGYRLDVLASSATDSDIFRAGMSGVSNGFTIQRVSSNFRYVFTDGNVGIGTTSPVSKLSVGGNGYSGRAITAIANNADYAITFQQDSSSGAGLQIFTTATTWGSFPLNISDGTSTQLRITSGGNLLVGTPTDAGFKLDVNGTGRFSGDLTHAGASATSILNIYTIGGTTYNYSGVSGAANSIINGSVLGDTVIRTINKSILFSTNNGSTSALTISTTGAATFSSSVTAKGDLFIWGGNAAQAGQITANSAGGGLYIGASGTNQNIRLVPSGTGIVQSLGSFDVQGAATFSSSVTTTFLRVSDSAGQIGEINSSNANGGYIVWQTSGTTIADLGTAQQIFGAGGNDTFGINGRGARAIAFGTNNTERMRIASNGNLILSSTTAGGGTKTTFNVIENGGVQIDSSEGATQRYIEFTTGGTTKMLITAGGNVLVGTTTDLGAKLLVNGGIRTANPTGSTSNDWLLGRALVSGSSTPDRWIRVQIGNLYYDILAVYMGSV